MYPLWVVQSCYVEVLEKVQVGTRDMTHPIECQKWNPLTLNQNKWIATSDMCPGRGHP